MFFRHNTCSHTSRIDLLFEKQDLKLTEVLEHVEVLQEAKNKNKLLLKYLSSNEILSELIGIIITEPSEELSEDVRFKLPHIASELLNCDIPEIYELLSSNTLLLEHLYSFIEQDSPLNPLLSSFFSKAFGVLMKRCNWQNWYDYQVTSINFYNFLKEKDFIHHILKHIGTSAITDLVIKLITSAEEGVINNILLWLDKQDFIGSIIKLLDPVHDSDTHENACILLIDILHASKENHSKIPQNDPLLARLESPSTAEALLSQILGGSPSPSIIIHGISVLLALLDTQSIVGDYRTPLEVRESAIKIIIPAIPSFSDLLLDPSSSLSSGAALGPTRLSIAKLFAALLISNNMDLNRELTKSKTLDILLDLFFKYSLNNFLHYQVVSCILNAFNWNAEDKAAKVYELFSSNMEVMFNSYENNNNNNCNQSTSEAEETNEVNDNPLLVHLFTDCRLVERILEAWEENKSQETLPGFHRKGYMAHLTTLANIIVEYSNLSRTKKLIQEQLEKTPAWEGFVSGDLADINAKNAVQDSFLSDLNSQRQFENESMFKHISNLDSSLDDDNSSKNIIEMSSLKSVDCITWMRQDNNSDRNFDDDLDDDDEDIMKDEENENEWGSVDSQIAIDSGNPWENIADGSEEGCSEDPGPASSKSWASFNNFGSNETDQDPFFSKVEEFKANKIENEGLSPPSHDEPKKESQESTEESKRPLSGEKKRNHQ
eukprot:TRINITY_DN2153_c0_g1_i1.p1 TRINITY_DN2153_c0_g1~~TRINITY_DN2153_c0_g1_i1.p1  ORF type:complete len:717 (-),score=202.38 TRINITY_DN2153_c0_g1_i1:436-2586(-)